MNKTFTLLLLFITLFYYISAQTPISVSDLADVNLSAAQKKKIEAAFAAMDAVQKASAYVESLQDLFEEGIVTLPVGIKKGDYELIIQKLTFDNNTGKTKIYATCAFKFKDSGQQIAFEGWTDLEGMKGIGTQGALELIAPVRRNVGSQFAILFNSGTKANFGCEGVESFYAKLNLFLTSEKIQAVDQTGKPTGKMVNTTIETAFHNFDDYTISFGFNQLISIKGVKDIIFSLKGATLDQSDIETPVGIEFPEDYFTSSNENEKQIWKGLSFKEAALALPPIFKRNAVIDTLSANQKGGSVAERIMIGVHGFIIDENGLSGKALAKNIINSATLPKDKWAISITDFSLSLLKNAISGIGFGGDMNLPPLGKSSLLPYMAHYNESEDAYEFQVNIHGEYDFPVLRSTLTLNESSSLEVLIKDADFYPTLNASGMLSIDAPINKNDSTKKFSLPDIAFQNMLISREDPYFGIGAIGVSGNVRSPKVAGFELTIEDIKPFTNNLGTGLSFDAGVKLSSLFGGEAQLQLYGDYSKWRFKSVALDKVNVDFKSGAYSVNGGVAFKNGDEVYGSGFRGDIKFTLIDKFDFDAIAVFGKKDDYRYFLTDVFYETSPYSGLKIPPALSFYGFGGGLYKRMQQTSDKSSDSEFGESLSGIHYVPDKNVGMGFMTATKFGLLGASSAFNAKVGFEMQFNQHGGLNFIQLRGDASFMNNPAKWGKLADNINDQVKKVEQSGGKVKLSAKSDLGVPENLNSGFLTASLNIKYDIANSIFSADLSTYLNAGFIRGVGQNNRMGWASAYFSPDKWYTYIGTPSDRLGIEILGLARSDGYFMVGDDIPELPPPPTQVLQNFSKSKQEQLKRSGDEHLATGSGLAFGSSLGVNFKATLPPFYAKLGVGLGAEFLLKNYGASAYCAGSSSTLGINGWYARAQAWAWVEADIGMEAKIFMKRRKFSILNMSASALLAGAGPNPFYFTGAVGGRFSVLGGLVSGQCNFDFEIGEECKIMGGSPFGQEVIAQLTPPEGEKGVNVFAAPQAIFNIPIDLEMEVDEDDGKMAWYKVTLEEFSIQYTDNNQKVEGYTQLSDDGKVYLLDPAEPFESNKEMRVVAKVGFKRKLNGNWIYVKGSDGKPVYEVKEALFTSGERPKQILPEHVVHSYPINRQYNYYPQEHTGGYVMTSENYTYLFTTDKPEGYKQVLRVTDTNQQTQETDFSFTTFSAGSAVRFELNYQLAGNINLSNDEVYQLAIVNTPERTTSMTENITSQSTGFQDNDSISVTTQSAEGTLEMLEEKAVYGIRFRTSQHNTFKAKMEAIEITNGLTWQEYPSVNKLISNIYDQSVKAEVFDGYESNWLNKEESLIKMSLVYSDNKWYTNKLAPLMYENKDLLSITNQTGIKPPDKPGVLQFVLTSDGNILSDDMSNVGTESIIYKGGSLQLCAPYYVDQDFMLLQNLIANRISSGTGSKDIEKFLASDHIPALEKGKYTLNISYTLPGKDIITSTVQRSIEYKN
ncbi:hypothetical protein [Carboxylicivirga taeanensis]|uniref:hypothetical protein n=1 Tax=Carboxylicivirga taeanensis TaxID=1416875 RepID=UPI003F6E2A59